MRIAPLSDTTDMIHNMLERASKLSGTCDDHWNRRFREALVHEGLILYEYIEPDEGNETYLFAPLSHSGQHGWRKEAWITFAPGGAEWHTQTTIHIPTGLPKA